MKQVAQNYRSGELSVLDVPPPRCLPGGVLVRTRYSLISTGTELMKVNESKMSLIGKARSRPEQVAKVLETATQQGPMSAYRKAMNRLDSYTPLGYSLAGVVVEVGRGAEEFKVGQLVACAGNEFALHAEVNWVPRNLCVPVPDGVDAQLAAFSTVGAIAMQGVRQGGAQLGDTACVIGLGLVGQLVVQLLVASGVRVVGVDVVASRCRLAEKAGALFCAAPDADGLAAIEQQLADASGGLGADRVFLVAGGSSNTPVEVAARLARDRATVVDIGKCKLDLPWNAYYEKELDVRFSRSYGPGRYDPHYEIEGFDYPAGYVRWTERRNLQCFLDLIAKREIDPEPLVSGVFPLADATSVYERLQGGTLEGVGFLFECDGGDDRVPGQATAIREPSAKRMAPVRGATGPAVRIGFIGAGNYASSMLLPHLAGRADVELSRVATNRSLSAANAQRKFGFAAANTDADAVLSDETIDAVFVVTRHSSHAELTCRALEAGKAVFVEKPLALTIEETERILATVDATGNDRLMVGFNRRFAPLLVDMKKRYSGRAGGSVARYLVNAGQLASDSWYRNEDMEGSRFVGEGGHFIDTISWWLGADPAQVSALQPGGGGESVQVTVHYTDGSLATITYLVDGHPRFPKETFDVSSGRRSARLDNFKTAAVYSGRRRRVKRAFGSQDKGQRGAIDAFVGAVQTGGAMPIPLSSLLATTRATLAVSTSLASGIPEQV
jgi:predicted dehydrogenase/threonine dehydrogenase-like Zn-dependent dehydrogenase